MARMIAPVQVACDTTGGTQRAQSAEGKNLSLRSSRSLRSSLAAGVALVALASPLRAHDLERTHVLLTFARDGSFVLDVANDPRWLKLRLESFPGSFADRIVLWVDGHEVRPTSVEYLPAAETDAAAPLGRHRLRGRFPADAHTLRWYYGLVIDPYPLTVRRADGRMLVEEISGDAWSRTIDVSGQFKRTWVSATVGGWIVAGLLLVPLAIRIATKTRKHRSTGSRQAPALS
jgi:hypothetical protein